MILSHMKKMHIDLRTEIASLENKVKRLPEGELLLTRNGPYVKWHISNGATPIYIKKNNRHLAEQLALKKYYNLQLEQLQAEDALLNECLEKYLKKRESAKTNILNEAGFLELIRSGLQSYNSIAEQWLNEEYEHNLNYPEALKHKTLAGHKVRSKSEMTIADFLYMSHIPYRYECALKLEGKTFFPDFTVLNPETGKITYWEHFGKMGDSDYRKKVFYKLRVMGNHNIIPTINLITTYETLDHPIDSDNIWRIIEEYFSSEEYAMQK